MNIPCVLIITIFMFSLIQTFEGRSLKKTVEQSKSSNQSILRSSRSVFGTIPRINNDKIHHIELAKTENKYIKKIAKMKVHLGLHGYLFKNLKLKKKIEG